VVEQPQNLVQLLLQNLNRRPLKQALYAKRQGIYTPVTYQEWFEQVKWFALGLSQLAVGENDFIALISANRPEWVIADMGIMSIGAVNVPIYSTLTEPEIAYILNDAKAKMVVVETQEHLDKVLAIADSCPTLTRIITVERHLKNADPKCMSMEDVQLLGKQSTSTAYDDYLTHLDRISSDHLASVVYTSGTTGEPKGVMLSHGNFLADVRDILLALPVTESDVVLSFLPLSHVFERTTGYYSVIAAGGSIYYAESMDTIAADMLEARPTVVVSVPRLYEKMQVRIKDSVSGFKKQLFNWAIRVAQWKGHESRGRSLALGLKFQYWIADRLVLKKIRERTGGRLRFFVSGGAPLSKDIARFFENVGLLIIEGYGLTETSPVIACNRLDNYKLGTVGKALPSQEIRLCDDGELQVKGPIVMKGYLNLPEKTAEVLDDDGWFHTGDIAEIDSDGFISIVDRKKDLIVLSNGKKVAPQMVELRLKSDPMIAQAIVCGESRNYLVALIVPDFARIRRIKKLPMHFTETDIAQHPKIVAMIRKIVDKKMRGLANFEQIKTIALLDREFTIDSGELTPSMKPRRKIINHNYASVIEQMYVSSSLAHNQSKESES